MKAEFIKEYGKVVEKLEIDNQPKYIYLRYFKGYFQQTAFISKNNPYAVKEFLENFFKEYYVSDEIQWGVQRLLEQESKVDVKATWQEFVNFLTITLSFHIMVGAALGLCIFGGFKLGSMLDARFEFAPAFTIVGVMMGLVLGSLTGYTIITNYLGKLAQLKEKDESFKKKEKEKGKDWPDIEVTLDQIREAVRLFARDLPEGMKRTILIKSDYSIDFEQLAPYLGGIPVKPYYMSRETFEIYEDNEIPSMIDRVQRAVNLFYRIHKQYPIRPYDSLRRVNYHQLLQGHYLDEMPKMDFYFTDYEGIITDKKPAKKSPGGSSKI